MGFSDLVAVADRAAQVHLGGSTVSYQPGEGEAVDVVALFDERFVLQSPGEGAAEQVSPALFCRLEDLPTDPDEDDPTITVGDRTFEVWKRERDGMGGIRLLLHLLAAEGS